MVASHAPHTGFGYELNTSVKFRLLRVSGAVPNWTGAPRIHQFTIPNSDRVITQRSGRTPYQATFRLWFDDSAHLSALDAMAGYRASLWYVWGITVQMGGVLDSIAGVDYLRLDDVLLVNVDTDDVNPNGTAEATVTFQKVPS